MDDDDDDWMNHSDNDLLEASGLDETIDTTPRLQNILDSIGRLDRARGTSSLRLSGITVGELQRLISGNTGFTAQLSQDEEDEDEEDEDYETDYVGSRNQPRWYTPPKEPQEAGMQLLRSGEFGLIRNKRLPSHADKNLGRQVRRRTQTLANPCKEDYTSTLLPNSNGTVVADYDYNVYTGQFSNDSSFYYTCSQNFQLHVYDSNAPMGYPQSPIRHEISSDLKTTMRLQNSIHAHPGRWTITDANLSPDNTRMIYASITSTAHMTSILESSPAQIPIPFDDPRRWAGTWGMNESFSIWSCRFSADGNEVVAGGSGKLFVYDLPANRRTVKIEAHGDDVNSCCWADTASGNVLVSASDDSFLKVWDRRSLGESAKPSGVLVGHTEGITYVSAKGDGRYVISNGKDQALRLWDLRKMCSSPEFDTFEHEHYGQPQFDYRYPAYFKKPRFVAHPRDCSVMTYRGHSVFRTLIRCHFSPAETTGSQYIYSGSSDGQIHIWSLDGRIVQVLDRSKTTSINGDPSGPDQEAPARLASVCVRDLSWHSQEPVLMSAAWENSRGGSTVARHEWKGLSKLSGNLEDWNERASQEGLEQGRRRSARLNLQSRARQTSQQMPGSFVDHEDDLF